MRLQQTLAVAALDLRRRFTGNGALPSFGMALIPVWVAFLVGHWGRNTSATLPRTFAEMYQILFLQGCLFFGCAFTFGDLVRGEVLQKSLHYWFLTPVRRELIVLGKYLSAVAGTSVAFCLGTVASSIALAHRAGPDASVLAPGGVAPLLAYLGTTVLACAGYGALFLVVGVLFKSPFIPAVVIWGLERGSFILPDFLQKVMPIYYLRSLVPVTISEGPLAVLVEPVAVPVAVLVLLVLTAGLCALAAVKIRTVEVAYGTE